ncbi:hypothetical protein CEXT_29071 [Caerostris extrusa]|uniref:Uncharacterized protein n=1 Tax=Caerostris extrusa TaxID=172846 RepID=A0AAV4VM21_CAEEX|nr:hypothetical protein CEXT_29071 [Caerostris extrusa]
MVCSLSSVSLRMILLIMEFLTSHLRIGELGVITQSITLYISLIYFFSVVFVFKHIVYEAPLDSGIDLIVRINIAAIKIWEHSVSLNLSEIQCNRRDSGLHQCE